MKTAEQFWRDLEIDPPHPKVLEAEKKDLTYRKIEMIASVTTFDSIMNALSPTGAKLVLAGMYLQGSLTSNAREAFNELIAEIQKREIAAKTKQLPQRKGKTDARIARGL